MGVVYKAHDTKLDRDVALKFLPHYLTSDSNEKERFYHEARAASALNHPNITTIYEIQEHGEQIFIAMEFVEGKTLKESMVISHWSLDQCLSVAIQVCEGLAAAHEKGIIHRDIKSENIILSTKGQTKIMDFGLAKVKGATKLTKAGSTLGTAAYMSPEQARGEEVDHRSDIFSFGVVLYELLTSKLPFRGEHHAALMYSIINEQPQPVARFNEKVTPEIERIVAKALEKDRDDRYQHVDDMLSDLRRERKKLEYAKAGQVPATVPSIDPAAVSRRTKVIITLGVVALLIFAMVVVYLFYPKSEPTTAKSKSIAVLPFKNMSDSKEDEYFSDGLTEDIITQLSKISGIEKVIARTSVMRYKETDKSIRDIGKELDVATILEGSVRRAGNQVRVVAQLIDVQNEGHLWADTYDKEMTQVFAIQSDVAKQIAAALEAKISPSVKSRIDRTQTGNAEAYQLYLKGRFYWNKRRLNDMYTAIDCFKQAIEKDPAYAQAYAGLAISYVILPSYGISTEGIYTDAQNTAMKALEIDSTLAEAHTVLGEIAQDNYYDWERAEEHFRRAIDLDPGYPTVHQWYSTTLTWLSRFEEALSEAKRALELDPLSLVINLNLGDTYYGMRQYDKAMEQYKNTLALDENFPWAHSGLGNIYELQGKYDEAIAEYKRARILAENVPFTIAPLGWIYAKAGRKNDALHILDTLLQLSRQGYSISYGIAFIYYELGEKDRAFEWLEKSYENREMWLLGIAYDPLWDNARADPKGIALLKKMGLRK